MNKLAIGTALLMGAVALSGCMKVKNGGAARSAEPQGLIKTIGYNGGAIEYHRDPNVEAQNLARICLVNQTARPKSLVWSKVQGPPSVSQVGNLVAKPNGGQSCASIPVNQRAEFAFTDQVGFVSLPVKKDAMSLNGFKGDRVRFVWVKDS